MVLLHPLSSVLRIDDGSCLDLASAGEMGGMMGKKLGLGWSRALPVIRQKEDILALVRRLFIWKIIH